MASNRIQGITVEIGGDTTKLTTALKSVNTEIRTTQTQLKDVEKLLKLDPGNIELLSQKHRLLGQAITETKEKLEALKLANEQANEALKNGTITQQQYDGLQREIIETEEKLKGLEKQADASSVALQKIGQAGEGLKRAGDSVTDVGKKMSVVSTGIVALGTVSANMAMNFEDAMAKVSTIADTTQVPLGDLQNAILELSNQTGISSTEIANNVYDAISAGQSTGDAVNFVANSTKLAKAGFAEAGDSLDILTTIMNAYGLEASEVNNVSDMLIQTQNIGKTTVGELSTSMGKIIPTANAYGVELDQLCAGYALMTSNGVATAETTTYMNSMLNELGKSGTTVSDILKEKTGSSFSELIAKGYSLSDCLDIIKQTAAEQNLSFSDMWSSSEAAKAGLILLGDSAATFNQTLSQMNQSTGATEDAFGKLKTNSYNIQMSINQVKNAAIELGTAIMQVLAPILMALSQKITELTKWFSGLSEENKQMIVTIGLIIATVGPMLIVIGKVITAIGTIMTVISSLGGVVSAVTGAFGALSAVMLANPIGLIIAAIAALIAIFVLLWNNCDGFRAFWIDLWETIKNAAIAVWTGLRDFFTSIWEGIKNAASSIWESIKTIITTVVSGISDFLTGAWEAIKNFITGAFDAIKSVCESAWIAILHVITGALDTIKNAVVLAWNALKDAILSVMEVIQSVIAKAWDAIKEAVLTVMEAIQSAIVKAWETIKECVSNVVQGIKDVVIQVWTSLKGAVEAVMEALKQGIINSWNGVKETVASVVEAVRSAVVNVFSKLAEGVSGAMKNVLSVVKGGFTMVKEHIFGIAKEAFEWGKDFIMGIVNGIKSCIGKIKDAVTNVADTIKSFLHFSVPDVGPLTDYETWMPDFMSGLASGIENSRGMVAAAMKHVAKDMVLSPTISASTMQSSMSGTLQSNASIATKLDAMTQLMGRYLPKMAGSQIVLDSGVLVGELTDGINRQLGKGYV